MNRICLRHPLLVPMLTAALVPGLFACSDDGGYADDEYGTFDGDAGEVGDELGEDVGSTGDSTTGTTGAGEDGYDSSTDDAVAEETDTTDTTETGEPMCDDQTEVVLYLSPDDSNSMSSPVQVRKQALDHGSLNSAPIRSWEFMNYYSFDYPAAEDGTLAMNAALRMVEGADPGTARFQLQIAVNSEEMTPEERPPMNVTLVVDTSGSMAGASIALLRDSCRAIAANLRAGDKVSMVEWDTQNTWVLGGYAVQGPNDPTLLDAIDALEAGGGTDLNGGLTSGYELAQQIFDINALNRLVLISDGGANAGVTDIQIIAENAVYGGSDGIYLVGVGVGDGYYNDQLMDTVTDAGKGAAVYIDSEAEAWKIFDQDFVNTMGLAARNVQVELTMPPGFEIVKFSGEEFSGDPKEIEPQHIAPNDSMVFFQQIETCAPELAGDDAQITVRATWEDIETYETMELVQSYSFAELLASEQNQLLEGAAILATVDALKVLRSQGAVNAQPSVDAAFVALGEALAAQPGDPDLLELEMVLEAVSN